eukprot:TRINITY_DN5683_c6_g1_i1.p1 TRINITY_DN5683_c6_g1~~TRINITY_DN5683_c6_g1_i1.p1  ORF type:complete len:412 (+),score=54.47 TRINITY_DN5683_c6_g1_i1:40-1236(+)
MTKKKNLTVHLKLLASNRVAVCPHDKQGTEWRSDKSIKLRGMGDGEVNEVVLSSDIKQGGNLYGTGVGVVRPYFVPLLKSGIQKSVRRGLCDHAVSLSQQMMLQSDYSAEQFLRRISIINVEDSMLHPELFSLSTWCMMALTRGYTLQPSTQRTLLQYISEMAAFPGRMSHDTTLLKRDEVQQPVAESPQTKMLKMMLRIRRSYGGMSGDMRMLDAVHDYAAQYSDIFTARQVTPPTSITSNDFMQQIPYELRSEYHLPEAVDFHCYPSMPAKVATIMQWSCEFSPTPDPGLVEKLWWRCQSGVYVNKPIILPSGRQVDEVRPDPEEAKQWDTIRGYANVISLLNQCWRVMPIKDVPSPRPSKGGNRIKRPKVQSDQPTISSAFKKSKPRKPEVIVID